LWPSPHFSVFCLRQMPLFPLLYCPFSQHLYTPKNHFLAIFCRVIAHSPVYFSCAMRHFFHLLFLLKGDLFATSVQAFPFFSQEFTQMTDQKADSVFFLLSQVLLRLSDVNFSWSLSLYQGNCQGSLVFYAPSGLFWRPPAYALPLPPFRPFFTTRWGWPSYFVALFLPSFFRNKFCFFAISTLTRLYGRSYPFCTCTCGFSFPRYPFYGFRLVGCSSFLECSAFLDKLSYYFLILFFFS